MKPPARYWPYFLAAAVVFVEVVLSIRLLPHYLADVNSKRAESEALAATIIKLTAAKEVLDQANPQTIKDDLDLVTIALPDEKKVSGLVTGLTSLASVSGVIINGLEFSPGQISSASASPVADNVAAVPASLTVVTSYSSLVSLLKNLNSISQLVSVRAISAGTSGHNQTSAQFSVLVYYQPVSAKPVDFESVQALTSEDEAAIRSLSPRDVLSLPEGSR